MILVQHSGGFQYMSLRPHFNCHIPDQPVLSLSFFFLVASDFLPVTVDWRLTSCFLLSAYNRELVSWQFHICIMLFLLREVGYPLPSAHRPQGMDGHLGVGCCTSTSSTSALLPAMEVGHLHPFGVGYLTPGSYCYLVLESIHIYLYS